MLHAKIEKALNDQITLEASAWNYYLAMASWCESEQLDGSAKFLYAHSKAELDHMMKLFSYINQQNARAQAPAVRQSPQDYKSLEEVFELALDNEKKVTAAIHKLVELTLSLKDFGTFNFLQWYVAEQQEEEQLFQSIHDKIRMIGIKDSRGLFMADKYIAKLLAVSSVS